VHQTQAISDHHVTEDGAMASEIEQLPDLTGFLKGGVAAGMAAGRNCGEAGFATALATGGVCNADFAVASRARRMVRCI
jgi:hypothetical protein